MRFTTRARSFHLILLALLPALTYSTGCGQAGVIDRAGGANTSCAELADETILISDQLVAINEETGELDLDLTCQFLANELRLLDQGCITEADIPEGATRESLLGQQEEFGCTTE